jgi:nucleoside-diphosphate-sugar epimerase
MVTGASGGLGLSLVAALTQAGREVVAVGRRETDDPRLRAPNVAYRRGDLSDRTICEILMTPDIGVVFHCAALSSPWGRAEDFRLANVEATRNLVHAAERNGVGTFVHVSTPSIYAAMTDRVGLVEDDPVGHPPLSHYARTKLEAERIVLAADVPMRTVAIRPRGIVGPDDAVVLPRLAAMASRGRIPMVRGGRALVEMIDVRDVVSALLAAEERIDVVHGLAVNVSGGRPMSVRDAASGLAKAMGFEPAFTEVPLAVARAAAGAVDRFWPEGGSMGEPKLTRYALATLAYSQTFDLSRARDLLGWEPRRDAFDTLFEQARTLS